MTMQYFNLELMLNQEQAAYNRNLQQLVRIIFTSQFYFLGICVFFYIL